MKGFKANEDLFSMLISSETGCAVVREYKFHPVRRWRFDYAILTEKVAVEVEGGLWTKGRHISPKGFIGDMDKYNTATQMGWRVLRILPDDMMKADTFTMIKETIKNVHPGQLDKID